MTVKAVSLVFILVLWSFSSAADDWEKKTWNYDHGSNLGPNKWTETWSACSGSGQSPVDIETNHVWYSHSLTGVELVGYENIPPNTHWELVNVGHSVILDLNSNYRLREGGLGAEFKALYLTFHWGSNNVTGSEHTIDGQAYAMEMQVVHYNLAYPSYEEALKHDDGIAILAFLVQAKPYGNPSWTQIINNLQNITEEGSSIPLRPLPLLSLFPINTNHYYRYHGSLTTPPCNQVAVWTVFSGLSVISEEQIKAFRSFRSHPSTGHLSKFQRIPKFQTRQDSLRCNSGKVRPLQPLGDRTIYSSHNEHMSILTSPTASTLSIILAVGLGFVIILLVLVRPSCDVEEVTVPLRLPLDGYHED